LQIIPFLTTHLAIVKNGNIYKSKMQQLKTS
jgi:hypothetical protein